MPMRPRTTYSLLAVFALLCALGAALYLRQQAPPEAARLLPESDAIVFVNLRPIRALTHLERTPFTQNSYKDFIDATGVLPERDLDAVAIALHAMPDPGGPNGPVGFTEVFEGRFDRERLSKYLAAHAAGREEYAGRTIYALKSEGRTVRVALLGYEMVAASNMPTTEQIHSILDRQRAAASPFAGSSLLSARYGEVPAVSKEVWAIGKLGLPFAAGGRISAMGVELPLAADTSFVASVGFAGALKLRVDALAADEAEAARTTQALNGILGLARGFAVAEPKTAGERAWKEAGDSVAIEARKDRAVVTATIPVEAVKAIAETK
jgi:hypothetical protein